MGKMADEQHVVRLPRQPLRPDFRGGLGIETIGLRDRGSREMFSPCICGLSGAQFPAVNDPGDADSRALHGMPDDPSGVGPPPFGEGPGRIVFFPHGFSVLHQVKSHRSPPVSDISDGNRRSRRSPVSGAAYASVPIGLNSYVAPRRWRGCTSLARGLVTRRSRSIEDAAARGYHILCDTGEDVAASLPWLPRGAQRGSVRDGGTVASMRARPRCPWRPTWIAPGAPVRLSASQPDAGQHGNGSSPLPGGHPPRAVASEDVDDARLDAGRFDSPCRSNTPLSAMASRSSSTSAAGGI